MARQSLEAELKRYLKLAEDEGRAQLAKTLQQEVILHVDDYTDALYIEYEKQHGLDKKEKDRRTTQGKKLKKAFDAGGQAIVDRLLDKLGGMRQSDGVTTYPTSVLNPQSFDDGKGIVIYMLSPSKFSWETPKFRKALSEAKGIGLETVNDELAKLKKSTLATGGGGTNSSIFGHHGGISGADPKTTYGFTGLSDAVNRNKKIDLANVTLNERIDDNYKLDTYADIFFKKLGDDAKFQGFWEAKNNARRPSESRPAEMKNENIIRIVIGHKNLDAMSGFDRVNAKKNWTGLGPTLERLLNKVRDDVEKDILKQLGRNSKDIAFLEGSESPVTQAQKLAGEQIVKRLVKGANKKKKVAKGKSQKIKKTKSKTVGKAKSSKKSKNTVKKQRATRAGVAIRGTKTGKGRRNPAATSSPVGLAALINKSLANEVIANMGPYPRVLENRTGRFANSAEVLSVAPLPNSVEIRYTYQKDPYAVFEPENGNALASFGRDPKRIIGRTVREIAQEIMGTKYGLVRTKRV